MIDSASVLAIIPARGGSKGLPRKNVLDLAGKPLIAWTIEAARQSAYIDRLVLSSNDAEIIQVAKHWGCEVPFVRPDHLAEDQSTAIEAALHALDQLSGVYDYLVWLQPTTPLRLANDIDSVVRLCVEEAAVSAVSVVNSGKSPYWMYAIEDDGILKPILSQDYTDRQRQALPSTYTLNGAVYVTRIDWLQENHRFMDGSCRAWVMPPERSIDIDTHLDFKLANLLLAER
ncbi:MAG: acylneuraminate cytidylyltransferase family protein [Magnetococcales bacterium]|nr:acylneuraminate cytidylyltransferase family protein [Magnetococcales bacterium]